MTTAPYFPIRAGALPVIPAIEGIPVTYLPSCIQRTPVDFREEEESGEYTSTFRECPSRPEIRGFSFVTAKEGA